MTIFRILGSALLILALTAPSVRADDMCLGDEEEKATKATIAAALKAEKSAKAVELFVVYRSIANDDCVDRFDKNNFRPGPRQTCRSSVENWRRRQKPRGCCIRTTRREPMGRRRPFNSMKSWATSTRPTG